MFFEHVYFLRVCETWLCRLFLDFAKVVIGFLSLGLPFEGNFMKFMRFSF